MARSIDTIQQQIIDYKEASTELTGLSTDSRRGLWRAWTRVVATCINIVEQLTDVFKTDVETIVASAAPCTAKWIQSKVFEFQYDALNPQVIDLVDLVPTYPTVDEDLRIVTRCSVKSNLSNVVTIKTAKNDPPEALVVGEISALQDYVDTIGMAGIVYQVSSGDPDRLYLDGDIYFKGQYSAVIENAVIDAIEAYLAALPFDGQLLVSDIEQVILAVEGVNDVVLNNVRARASTVVLGSATYLVNNNQLITRAWATVAGYMIQEDTASNTFADTLTFIPE
jgi:hypothetical protein